jgi:hypothetical protein
MRTATAVLFLLAAASTAWGGEASFSTKPTAAKDGDKVKIGFAVSAPTDVEAAMLAVDGKVVRHLAAGVLGGTKPPPEPLKAGLAQELVWDGKDDFGKPAAGGPFKVRVRAGLGVKFARFIGEDPYNFGAIDGIVADEDGSIYVKGFAGASNQSAMCIRAFDATGKYLREILPFPADLPVDAMKDVARWDDERKTFFPRNLKNLTPEFYGGGRAGNLTMVCASKKNGVVLTDGRGLHIIDTNGAVRGASLTSKDLGACTNNSGGPVFVALSPDGQWAYLSGPYSSSDRYGWKYDPKFPPGRVYRARLAGAEKIKEFVTIAVDHKDGNGGAWTKACAAINHFTVPKGPVHQVAVDDRGNVYVADRERGCVAVFDESGKEIGKVVIKNPHLVAVHPKTGAIYVTQFDCLSYSNFQCVVHKFDNYKEGAQPVAKYEFPAGNFINSTHSMALSVGKDKTVIWMAGVKGGVAALEDKGTRFELLPSVFGVKKSVPTDWNRLAVDYGRDEVYVSNGTVRTWRFNGMTGDGDILKKDGKEFLVNELAVGYDGLLYVRVSNSQIGLGSSGAWSGPLWRMDRDLKFVPYATTGTHELTPYIFSRYGIGYAERGLGVGPDGKCYISMMYNWCAYAVGGFGPEGKPLNGKYLKGVFPSKDGKAQELQDRVKYPADWNAAIIGPITGSNGGVRVDLQGNIYVGLWVWPKDARPPKGFEKDTAYKVSVGSVVRFKPEGGFMAVKNGDWGSDRIGVVPRSENASGIDTVGGNGNPAFIEGATGIFPGVAPFSHCDFGGNTCCVCRGPRFDLDRFGRLALPNAITNSVLLYDNAGNLILEFGKYGNFDSQFVNPFEADEKKKGRPAVAVPEIPLAWPTGAGFSEERIYVNDTYNRRVVRVDKKYAAEELCEAK